jgi:hypothetical protein
LSAEKLRDVAITAAITDEGSVGGKQRTTIGQNGDMPPIFGNEIVNQGADWRFGGKTGICSLPNAGPARLVKKVRPVASEEFFGFVASDLPHSATDIGIETGSIYLPKELAHHF